MTPHEFIAKWRKGGDERRDAQPFFEPEVVPGYPDRIVAKPGFEAELKKRTLTNLYNARPAWLDYLHRDLDAAVATAYGWEWPLSDDDILKRLFELNQARTGKP